MKKKNTEYAVTQKVHDIGMQSKGSYQTKELGVVENGLRVPGPFEEPYGLRLPVAGYPVQPCQATDKQKGHCLENRRKILIILGLRWPVGIFTGIG